MHAFHETVASKPHVRGHPGGYLPLAGTSPCLLSSTASLARAASGIAAPFALMILTSIYELIMLVIMIVVLTMVTAMMKRMMLVRRMTIFLLHRRGGIDLKALILSRPPFDGFFLVGLEPRVRVELEAWVAWQVTK